MNLLRLNGVYIQAEHSGAKKLSSLFICRDIDLEQNVWAKCNDIVQVQKKKREKRKTCSRLNFHYKELLKEYTWKHTLLAGLSRSI